MWWVESTVYECTWFHPHHCKIKLDENSLLCISGLSPFSSTLITIKNSKERGREKKKFKKMTSLWSTHIEQSCPKYCHNFSTDNSFHSRVLSDLPDSLTDYYIQKDCWKLSALRNALQTYKNVFIYNGTYNTCQICRFETTSNKN